MFSSYSYVENGALTFFKFIFKAGSMTEDIFFLDNPYVPGTSQGDEHDIEHISMFLAFILEDDRE